MNNAVIAIVATECRMAAQSETTLDGRIEKAFAAARNHWMATNENDQFTGAVCAVMELSDEETRERITQELDGMKHLNALLSGVSVDVDRIPEVKNPIGLMRRWHSPEEAGQP